jgi:L-iditol 2-dehydrogenase
MHLCPEKWTMGWRIDGCMAEYVVAPEMFLHSIPDGLSDTLAALCEPLAVAIYDIAEHGRIDINDVVVVQGSGPMGILAAYLAKRLGARYVIVTGMNPSALCRFGVAKALGADEVINVQQGNALDRVMQLTDGMGADCVIETSGAPCAIAGCVDMLKKDGRLIGLGIPADRMTLFPWRDAVLKAIEIAFSMSTSYTSWDKALCLLAQDGDLLQQLITWTGSLDDWEDVFQSLTQERNVKAVFTF